VAHGLYKATTDEEREKIAERMDKLSPRFLELAEKNPGDPIALDALVQVVTQETWLENNDNSQAARRRPLPSPVARVLICAGLQCDLCVRKFCRNSFTSSGCPLKMSRFSAFSPSAWLVKL
jgi:hypothetical protein